MKIKIIRPASKQNADLNLQEHSSRVLESYASRGTEVDVVFPSQGTAAGPMVGHINEARIASAAPFVIKEVVKAENEGFDAVLITGEYDVGAEVARHLVQIPVIDAGPVALHTAALLGDRICILVVEDSLKSYTAKLLKRWGMSNVVTSMKSWNIPISALWQRRTEVKDVTLRLCREAVAKEDAHVIVPFCWLYFLPEIMTYDEVEDEIGVPVLNTMAISLYVAEMFVNLKLSHSCKAYPFTPGGSTLFL